MTDRARHATRARGPRPPVRASSPTTSVGPTPRVNCSPTIPELGSAVLGRTTGSDEPATESGVDLSAGDNADAVTDGGPDLPDDAEPDLKDAPTARG